MMSESTIECVICGKQFDHRSSAEIHLLSDHDEGERLRYLLRDPTKDGTEQTAAKMGKSIETVEPKRSETHER